MFRTVSKAALAIGKFIGICMAFYYVIHFILMLLHHKDKAKAR